MVEKKSTKVKTASKPVKMGREARRVRTMNVIFLVITAILILSLSGVRLLNSNRFRARPLPGMSNPEAGFPTGFHSDNMDIPAAVYGGVY